MIVVCHCMRIKEESGPCRKIGLLCIAHPVVGITISGTEGAPGDETHPRP